METEDYHIFFKKTVKSECECIEKIKIENSPKISFACFKQEVIVPILNTATFTPTLQNNFLHILKEFLMVLCTEIVAKTTASLCFVFHLTVLIGLFSTAAVDLWGVILICEDHLIDTSFSSEEYREYLADYISDCYKQLTGHLPVDATIRKEIIDMTFERTEQYRAMFDHMITPRLMQFAETIAIKQEAACFIAAGNTDIFQQLSREEQQGETIQFDKVFARFSIQIRNKLYGIADNIQQYQQMSCVMTILQELVKSVCKFAICNQINKTNETFVMIEAELIDKVYKFINTINKIEDKFFDNMNTENEKMFREYHDPKTSKNATRVLGVMLYGKMEALMWMLKSKNKFIYSDMLRDIGKISTTMPQPQPQPMISKSKKKRDKKKQNATPAPAPTTAPTATTTTTTTTAPATSPPRATISLPKILSPRTPTSLSVAESNEFNAKIQKMINDMLATLPKIDTEIEIDADGH